MLNTIILSTAIITGLVLLWLFVQTAWGKAFADDIDDEDVLAGRSQCGNCGCQIACQKTSIDISKPTKA